MPDISTNRYDITMWQGATFGLTITVQTANGSAQNLTDYSARMQIRSAYGSGSITESLTTSNGEITITAANGTLALELSAARTANIFVDLNTTTKPPKTLYVYDLELVDSSNVVSKLIYGDVIVCGEVTR
jgi:hypothetical protein